MKTYEVVIEQLTTTTLHIQAESELEAREMARNREWDERHVLLEFYSDPEATFSCEAL